jgi:hypothetical protein
MLSPSNAPAMEHMLKAKAPKMPIMTIDADLANQQRADVFTKNPKCEPSSWWAAGRSSAPRPMRR